MIFNRLIVNNVVTVPVISVCLVNETWFSSLGAETL